MELAHDVCDIMEECIKRDFRAAQKLIHDCFHNLEVRSTKTDIINRIQSNVLIALSHYVEYKSSHVVDSAVVSSSANDDESVSESDSENDSKDSFEQSQVSDVSSTDDNQSKSSDNDDVKSKSTSICCLCHCVLTNFGNNPSPILCDCVYPYDIAKCKCRCCDTCNTEKVVPTRIVIGDRWSHQQISWNDAQKLISNNNKRLSSPTIEMIERLHRLRQASRSYKMRQTQLLPAVPADSIPYNNDDELYNLAKSEFVDQQSSITGQFFFRQRRILLSRSAYSDRFDPPSLELIKQLISDDV
jgi:hypothetical protein